MKTFNFFPLIFVCTVVMLVSCLKDDDNNAGVVPLIQHNWTVDSVTLHTHTSVSDNFITYTGQPADYFNFGTDGKLYSQLNGDKDTSMYSFLNDNTIILQHTNGSKDTGTILVLTASRLIGTSKKMTNSTDYSETTSYLKR